MKNIYDTGDGIIRFQDVLYIRKGASSSNYYAVLLLRDVTTSFKLKDVKDFMVKWNAWLQTN